MKKEKKEKILAFLKNNWGSTLTLTLATASALVGFFLTGDKWTLKALSVSVGLIAGNLFLLIGKHLESIQNALKLIGKHLESIQNTLKEIKKGGKEGTQLVKWNRDETGHIINDAEEELFFCGWSLSRLPVHRDTILKLPAEVRMRLLATDVTDVSVLEQCRTAFGQYPTIKSLDQLKQLSCRNNTEIRIVKYPLPLIMAARDMSRRQGHITVAYRCIESTASACMELTPTDTDWYEFYKSQIELLWAQGTPWPPPTKEG